MTRMENLTSPSPIPFILYLARHFLCCLRAMPGEKSGSSSPIHRLTKSALFLWHGPILPHPIPFWLLLLPEPCYALRTCNSLCSFSDSSRLTIRRAIDMLQQV